MMTGIMKLAALCLLGAGLAAVLRKDTPELALALVIAVVVAAFFSLAGMLEEVFGFFEQLLTLGGLSVQLFSPLLKTVAIALVSRSGAEVCRDAGAGAIGYMLETAGAIGAMIAAIPLFEAVWETIQTVL